MKNNKNIQLLLDINFEMLKDVNTCEVISYEKKLDIFNRHQLQYIYRNAAILILGINGIHKHYFISELHILKEIDSIVIVGNLIDEKKLYSILENAKKFKTIKNKNKKDKFFGESYWDINSVERDKIEMFIKNRKINKYCKKNSEINMEEKND